jgi:hypothetical protein
MLSKVSDQIRECLERAARLRGQAERAGNERTRGDFLDAEQRWLNLSDSYRFLEQSDRFVAEAEARRKSKE